MSPRTLRVMSFFLLIFPVVGLFTGYYREMGAVAIFQAAMYFFGFLGLRALARRRVAEAVSGAKPKDGAALDSHLSDPAVDFMAIESDAKQEPGTYGQSYHPALHLHLGAYMETHVEFRSDRFPPLEGEDKLINPDLWGKRLADFLREGLGRQGFETHEPVAEDWGWVVPVVNKPFRMWIGCGHYQEYEDGFLCFIEPHKPFVWKFFKRVDTRERVGALREAMDRVLVEEEGVRSKRWWTCEEFNKPSLDPQRRG